MGGGCESIGRYACAESIAGVDGCSCPITVAKQNIGRSDPDVTAAASISVVVLVLGPRPVFAFMVVKRFRYRVKAIRIYVFAEGECVAHIDPLRQVLRGLFGSTGFCRGKIFKETVVDDLIDQAFA